MKEFPDSRISCSLRASHSKSILQCMHALPCQLLLTYITDRLIPGLRSLCGNKNASLVVALRPSPSVMCFLEIHKLFPPSYLSCPVFSAARVQYSPGIERKLGLEFVFKVRAAAVFNSTIGSSNYNLAWVGHQISIQPPEPVPCFVLPNLLLRSNK